MVYELLSLTTSLCFSFSVNSQVCKILIKKVCAFSLFVFYYFNLQAPIHWSEEGRGDVYPPQQSHDKRLKTQLGKHFEAFIHITSANIPLANASHVGNHEGKEEYASCGGGRGLAFNFHLSRHQSWSCFLQPSSTAPLCEFPRLVVFTTQWSN